MKLGFESTSFNPLGLEVALLVTALVSGNKRESTRKHLWAVCPLLAHSWRAPWEKAMLIFALSVHTVSCALEAHLPPSLPLSFVLSPLPGCFCYKLTFVKGAT